MKCILYLPLSHVMVWMPLLQTDNFNSCKEFQSVLLKKPGLLLYAALYLSQTRTVTVYEFKSLQFKMSPVSLFVFIPGARRCCSQK